ncbi:hypothetical protein ES288_D06G132300v1 [Gossypium darwinii]|uniref:Uncharacterized protein n=1 Tax=Gossypium darwinii TaxID=34276 RepID=A0A5D2C561_GOSDA|nr:hypothetical protein ES288_D06G132300v1 [Gossypium darwinii]
MVKAVGYLIGVGNGGFSFWGAYNGALAWDFGEAGVYSRVLDGICQQKVWWWQRRSDRARNVFN